MANVITYGVTLDATGAISGFKKLDDAMDKSAKKAREYEKIGKAGNRYFGRRICDIIGLAVLAFEQNRKEGLSCVCDIAKNASGFS